MNRIVRVGHRGAAGYEPENTLGSLQYAINLGLDFAEFDVRRTQDGVLVLLHDKTVDRTTNGKGPVDHLSFRDLKALDAGHGNSIRRSEPPRRSREIRTPLGVSSTAHAISSASGNPARIPITSLRISTSEMSSGLCSADRTCKAPMPSTM